MIVSEQAQNGLDITERRAAWEMARRSGRSQAVTVTVDNWRDSAGAVWAPNTLTTVEIPELHLSGLTWLISEITFLADLTQGRRAQITLMPPSAFQPRPPSTLFDGALQRDLQQSIPDPAPSPPAPPVSTAGLQGRA